MTSPRAAKEVCDEGRGVGARAPVFLDFAEAIKRLGEDRSRRATATCSTCTSRSRTKTLRVPMRIYPAIHYTMGGLWVDYNLMSNVPGLHVLGEANFSDHGANRLGASALMQGLATATLSSRTRSATTWPARRCRSRPRRGVRRSSRLDDRRWKRCSPSRARARFDFHREAGQVLWDKVGMGRTEARCRKRQEIRAIRERFLTRRLGAG